MNNIKESISNKYREILKGYREILKRKFTGNLGKVEELDDRLICYVDGTKYTNFKYLCSGIMPNNKELAKKIGLDKPIYYVFDGIKFDCKELLIKGINNCNVIIKNCKFPWKIKIDVYGKCQIEKPFVAFCEKMDITTSELTIDSMNDSDISFTIQNTNIEIYGNKVNINNSTIGEHAQETHIGSDELNITHSSIKGNNISCTAEKLNVDKYVYFIPRENININVDKFEEININTPDITVNGKAYSGKKLCKEIKGEIE